jgi:gamma-glutamyl:cysteine ligase YbdK (ATP-grasp superfamily)
MGQEIAKSRFSSEDFDSFYQNLTTETNLLKHAIEQKLCSDSTFVSGLELEAWLINQQMQPAPINKTYLSALNHPLATAELAKFNIELNTKPLALKGDIFNQLQTQLQQLWAAAQTQAEKMDVALLMIGTLPTTQQSDLTLNNMSDLNRYRALNEQILHSRGKPIHLDITGVEHLKLEHHDVMLESAATSLQLHTKIPVSLAHHFYNASIIASAPMVALCANSPYLFGKYLWHESRIPIFEQAIETGGYDGAAHGPIKRVSFGSCYAKESIFECFQENLEHFPILLPAKLGEASDQFDYLRLHNGTIWRWNRPLIGFDDDGIPHIRIEHRTPAAGPSIVDTVANAAFYYGLAKNLCDVTIASGPPLEFSQAKDNFYQAARHGLDSYITWFDNQHVRISHLITNELIPRAIAGLESFNISNKDINFYMEVIQHRAQSKQNGCFWQHQYRQNTGADFTQMTQQYLLNQQQGLPVSRWELT